MKKLVIVFVIVLVVFLASIAFGEEKARSPRGEGFRGGPSRGMRMMGKGITPEMKEKFKARRAEMMKKMTPEMKERFAARRAEMAKKFAAMKKDGKRPEFNKRGPGRRSHGEKGKYPMMSRGRGDKSRGRGQMMRHRGGRRGPQMSGRGHGRGRGIGRDFRGRRGK